MGCLLWPFLAIWGVFGLFIKLTGHLLGLILGGALAIAGLALTVTLIGAVVGLPLLLVGGLLLVRAVRHG